jgi:putative PIN family toxin of toxin-antitoxin system
VLKVVIDTNVYISAIFWGGNPRKVIDLGRDGKVEFYTSEDIVKEIMTVLLKKFKLNFNDVERILLDFLSFTLLVKPTQSIRVISEDPEDDKFIECAISCNADYIVSGDRHLINLKEYEGIKIVNSIEFLSIIKT